MMCFFVFNCIRGSSSRWEGGRVFVCRRVCLSVLIYYILYNCTADNLCVARMMMWMDGVFIPGNIQQFIDMVEEKDIPDHGTIEGFFPGPW